MVELELDTGSAEQINARKFHAYQSITVTDNDICLEHEPESLSLRRQKSIRHDLT